MGLADARSRAGGVVDDPAAGRALVLRLLPVVRARALRVLRRKGHGQIVTPERLEDAVQEVFAFLFEDDGRVLGTWREGGGLSFENFVGLLAERYVLAMLRSGPRRAALLEDPTMTDVDDLEREPVDPGFEQLILSKDLLAELLDRLREALSPVGMELFNSLFLDQRAPDAVAADFAMSIDAIYKWRERLRKLVTRLVADLVETTPLPAAAGIPRQEGTRDGRR